MADMTELKNMVRLGTVMNVDKDKMTARVKFEDKGGIISSPLHILKRPVYVVPEIESGNIMPWVPSVNGMVLCIMMADGDGDGFIVGEV